MSITAISISPERDEQLRKEALAAGMDVPPRRSKTATPVAVQANEPTERIVVHTPQVPPVLSDLEQRLIKATVPLGSYAIDSSGVNHVINALNEREQAVRSGDAGKRLDAVRARQSKTAEQLVAAKSEAEQLEAAHFEALASGTDDQIESARNAVLAIQGRIALIEGEFQSLRSIELTARAALGNAIDDALPVLYDDMVRSASAIRQTALEAITAAMDAGLMTHFRQLGLATEILTLIGGDPQSLRANCSLQAWNRAFGRKRPANHVSLQMPEIRALDSRQLDGLRVAID